MENFWIVLERRVPLNTEHTHTPAIATKQDTANNIRMFSTRRGEYNVANLGYESIWCRWWLRHCAQSNAIIWPRGAGMGGGRAGDRIINTDLLDLSTNQYRSQLLRINFCILHFVFCILASALWLVLYYILYYSTTILYFVFCRLASALWLTSCWNPFTFTCRWHYNIISLPSG